MKSLRLKLEVGKTAELSFVISQEGWQWSSGIMWVLAGAGIWLSLCFLNGKMGMIEFPHPEAALRIT